MRRTPDGPPGWPLLGSLPAFSRNPVRFWMELAARYGPVARYRMGSEHHFLISDPDGIAHIFRQDTVRYYRGKYHDYLKPAFGEGLSTANGERWRRQRHFLQPVFAKHHVGRWLDIVISAAERRFARWSLHETHEVDIAREMAGLIQEINAQILFGRAIPYRSNDHLLAAVDCLNDSLLRQIKRAMFLGGVLNRLPLADVRRFRQAISLLHRTVDDLIALSDRQESGESLCAYFSQTAPRTGADRAELHLRDQMITLFLAGHETTAVAVAWTLYLLTEHPHWTDCLYQEASTVLADRAPTAADLDRLTQTRRVIYESLRLRPPIYGTGRRAASDDTILDCRIPAGSAVVISPYVMHHHPGYWGDPERFRPERFAQDRESERPPFSFLPFGGGPHVCIGRNLAMMELLALVALVVRAFRITAPPGRRVSPRPWLTLRPHPGVPLILRRRSR